MSFMEKLKKKKKNNSSKPKSLGDEIFSAVFVQYLVIWIIVLRGLIFVGDIPTSLYSVAIFSSHNCYFSQVNQTLFHYRENP